MTRSPLFFTPVARRVVEHHRAAPGAVVAASVRGSGPAPWHTEIAAAGDADVDTIYDLASLTKPVTAVLAARLVQRGELALSTALGSLLDEARGTPSEHVSIELLLAHRAGLAAHEPLYAAYVGASGGPSDETGHRARMLRDAASGRRKECDRAPPPDGFAPVYSDLGYLLAGEALSRLAGIELDQLFEREVLGPLGLSDRIASARQWRSRLGERAFTDRVAPTEDVPWRGGVVRGAVHDENAWIFGGEGASGHAGLFGTADAVVAFGRALLDSLAGRSSSFLGPSGIEPLVRPRPGGTLRAGFDGKTPGQSSAGEKFGPATFGHLGFTGASLWMDPDSGLVGVLLTNRVHPTRDSDAIRRARPDTYDRIFEWAENLQPRIR